MSKSGGNAVDPIKTINKWGADILRLWATTVDFSQMYVSLMISKESI